MFQVFPVKELDHSSKTSPAKLDNEHRKPKKKITIPLWKRKHKKIIHPSANAHTDFSLERFYSNAYI